VTVGFTPDKPAPSPSQSPGGFTPDSGGFTADQSFKADPKPQPKPTPSGLYSVNPGVNVVGDYLTKWTKYGAGGIRDAFRNVVDGLANTFHLGIYDFDKGHHYAPNDPHLDGRAMDVDTINGEMVGDKLTPTIKSYITTALATPNVRLGVPLAIYRALPADQRKRAFVDAPAHIHTELSQVMPGQTVAPAGFKPDTTQGFVKDPQSKPAFGDKPPSNPVILSGRAGGMTPSAQAAAAAAPDQTGQMAHSGLMEVAGHQDLPFILTNALMRDNSSLPSPKTVAEQLKDPKSHVYQAWHLYMKDPAQAMDEYGAGSPIQDQWMAQHGTGINQKTAQESLKHPFLNALQTFGMEQLNPMAWGEGAIAGKIVDLVPEAARALGILEKSEAMAQGAAKVVGMGTPLSDIRARGGVDASQHMKAGISALNAPHMNPYLSKKLPAGGEIEKEVFGGLTPDAQSEVVRLKQGLKPDPKFSRSEDAEQYLPNYTGRGNLSNIALEPSQDLALEDMSDGIHTPRDFESFKRALSIHRTGIRESEFPRLYQDYRSQFRDVYEGKTHSLTPGEGMPPRSPENLSTQEAAALREPLSPQGLRRFIISRHPDLESRSYEINWPDWYNGYRKIWSDAHPGEPIPPAAKVGQHKIEADPDLTRRAKILADDMGKVEHEQKRVDVLPPERTFNTKKFFPMKNSYDFGPQAELESELKGGQGAPGGGGLSQHKVHQDLDDSIRSGTLDKDFLASSNYREWRRQRLQRVAFEDWVSHSPPSLRRDVEASDFENKLGVPLSQPWQQNINHSVQETLDKWIGENNAKFPEGHPERYTLKDNPNWVAAKNVMPNPATSPALAKSMVAPEFWKFLNATGKSGKGDTKFGKYINGTGTFMPGQEQTWSGKYIAMARNAIISNFFFHPMVNIAGNDAVARGIYNLGGPMFGRGGYAYNAAKALALQAGIVKPEQFVGGAQAYASWLDRAMKAGGLAEFGEARTSAMGGDYARVMTVPPKSLLQRLDKALTKAGDFNRERTFGEKGEQAFAVSLFKDAVEKGGMSDAQAGEMVRQALGDYSNFDPKSPWSMFFFFMPWLKGNMKFWANTLIRRPQYVTGTSHGMRNYGLEESPESYQGAYPTGDFTTYGPGGKPYTMPFVGRDIGHVAQMGAQAIGGDVLGAASTGEQMLAGRATPPVRLVTDTLATINAAFSSDVKGPETDWNMVVNPRAPHDVQMKQAAGYFSTHLIPIPLFTYALQDAVRRGMTPSDLGQALMTAGGAGYFGEAKLDSFTKRQLKKAQSKYKKAYDNYRYNDFGNDYLKSAWDEYTDRLKDLGVVQ
jgi:hypothetical protein